VSQSGDINAALAAITGIGARDEIEGMLATQMVATHIAAIRVLRQLKGSETITQQDSSGNLAVKLLRTFTMQLEALQRYRGKGQQKVTVEHVHVNKRFSVPASGRRLFLSGQRHQFRAGSAREAGARHLSERLHDPIDSLAPSAIAAVN
jgi:hypothetical protein